MNERYLPPRITDELGRSAEAAVDRNGYSRGESAAFRSHIDGVAISSLVAEFGSPLFVFSERELRARARRARQAFESVYPKTSFAWSYKTNYLGAICNILHQEGWIAEVVSEFEYQKARSLGIPGKQIVFNGPHKSREGLAVAVREGALIQIDNWDELALLEEVAAGRDQRVDVGIRVWMDVGIRPVWSKFGFALGNGEAARAAARIVRSPNLRLHTLHSHIGTYVLAPWAYAVAAQMLLALREQIRQEHRHVVSCINLGGGFPSSALLHGMAGPPEAVIPPIESYAQAIAPVLNALPKAQRPLLRLESGRHLVDDAGSLISSVVAVKGSDRARRATLTGTEAKAALILDDAARNSYILDAGVNLLYTGAWYRFDILPTRQSDARPSPTRLYGCLCMAIDVIREYIELPPLETGDTVVMHPVGAYNTTQWMQFISYRPAVVLIGLDGRAQTIRRREQLSDIVGAEQMPEHLRSEK